MGSQMVVPLFLLSPYHKRTLRKRPARSHAFGPSKQAGGEEWRSTPGSRCCAGGRRRRRRERSSRFPGSGRDERAAAPIGSYLGANNASGQRKSP